MNGATVNPGHGPFGIPLGRGRIALLMASRHFRRCLIKEPRLELQSVDFHRLVPLEHFAIRVAEMGGTSHNQSRLRNTH